MSDMKSFKVTIKFINLPHYTCVVKHINEMQAKDAALEKHRLETGCGTDEMYDAVNSTAEFVGKYLWTNDEMYAKPSDDGMALRAQCGYVVGFPDSSASTINLHSQLRNTGEAMITRNGKQVKVNYC